jgi:integrase
MSIKVRPYRNGGWEVDIRVITPDGARQLRERKRATMSSKSVALRWAEGRERVLFERLMNPPQDHHPRKEVPTLRAFAPRFLDGHARANRQKPSGVAAKETILNVHLVPLFGPTRLDAITTEDVQRLKNQLRDRAPKTVNNVLTVLNMLLKKAVEWNAIERMPCTIRLLPIPKGSAGFYDFDEYERLVAAAKATDRVPYLIVLLGGEAGLRCGEMMALEWSDVDLVKRQFRVERSDWKGHVTATKGGRVRHVPMTIRLVTALREHRHLRATRVLCQSRRITTHTEDRPEPRLAIRTSGAARERGGASSAAHVLFAPGDARGAGAGNSRARRTHGSRHDPTVYASQSRGDRRRHSAA